MYTQQNLKGCEIYSWPLRNSYAEVLSTELQKQSFT